MAYAKFDDIFAEHPKVAVLSDAAFRTHVRGILYCNRVLSDGFVPRSVARELGRAVKELVNRQLWEEVPDGYDIHDFLEWNDSAETIRSKRDAKRMAGAMGAASRWGDSKNKAQGVVSSGKFKTQTTQPGVPSQKTAKQRLLLKAYEALPSDVLYPNGEQLSDDAAIAAYLRQRKEAKPA